MSSSSSQKPVNLLPYTTKGILQMLKILGWKNSLDYLNGPNVVTRVLMGES